VFVSQLPIERRWVRIMSNSNTAADVAEALAIIIVTLFEEGLDASLRSAETPAEFAQDARRFRELAEDAILLTASLKTMVRQGDQDAAGV
jgi:hypothetical protein